MVMGSWWWNWNWLWSIKLIEFHEDQKSNTNNIQKKSRKEIKANFQSLTNELLQNNLEYLVQKDTNIKKIFEIPELQNITAKEIKVIWSYILWMNVSTTFDGNLRQLLLKNWYNKNMLESDKDWVRVCLYWSSLQLFIKQEHLSK